MDLYPLTRIAPDDASHRRGDPTSPPQAGGGKEAVTQQPPSLRAKRSNPYLLCCTMDCFASLAMTMRESRLRPDNAAVRTAAKPTAPPSQTGHPAHIPHRARCGSGPARGRG